MRPYGLAEIAQALFGPDPEAIQKGIVVVRKWRDRGKLPAPTWPLKMGQVWQGPEIEEWIRQHRDGAGGGN